MKIAIVGGRDFNDYNLLKSEMIKFLTENENIEALVSGGAKGADSLAERLALELSIPIQVFKPDYKRYGRAATVVRNSQIVENSDVIFAFWNGKSKGTLDSINKAKKMNKKLFIVNY
jgi:hypothetical protein